MSYYHVIVFHRTEVQDHDTYVSVRLLPVRSDKTHWVSAPDMEVLDRCESREQAETFAQLIGLERLIPYHPYE